MNVYIHVEIAARELDSKLLLAVIAASRGHEVIVLNIGTIMKLIKNKKIAPGVFHTKSLTPGQKKINRHQLLKENGFLITSIDEEGNLVDHGYDSFAKVRYSEHTISQSAAVFCWGLEDARSLEKTYPACSDKVFKTGSPRADLWKPTLSSYWKPPKGMPARPYLLISSNMGTANNIRPLHEIVCSEREGGYYQRDPGMFERKFGVVAEDYRMTYSFIEAIQHLSKSNPGYDIVFRPHPVENIDAWKVYLEGLPNVHVIREGSITAWVNHAFAVMHNGCTTAMEANVSGKPVVTFIPFEQKFARAIPNELGEHVTTLDELSLTINKLFKEHNKTKARLDQLELHESVAKKIYIDPEELAAEKMVSVWEEIHADMQVKPNNWKNISLFFIAYNFKNLIKPLVRILLPGLYKAPKENFKFPPLDKNDIRDRVNRLRKILNIEVELHCKVLSDRAVLIKKISR